MENENTEKHNSQREREPGLEDGTQDGARDATPPIPWTPGPHHNEAHEETHDWPATKQEEGEHSETHTEMQERPSQWREKSEH